MKLILFIVKFFSILFIVFINLFIIYLDLDLIDLSFVLIFAVVVLRYVINFLILFFLIDGVYAFISSLDGFVIFLINRITVKVVLCDFRSWVIKRLFSFCFIFWNIYFLSFGLFCKKFNYFKIIIL